MTASPLARRMRAASHEEVEVEVHRGAVAYALRQVESGTPPADVCRQLGVREATFYIWKTKYAHLGVAERRKRRSLEEENSRLKRLVADRSLDKHMLTEALRNKV